MDGATMIVFLGPDRAYNKYKEFIKSTFKDQELLLSVQYREKIPRAVVERFPAINIHYGTLPYYAGCNPIYWQIMNGHTAGFTIHWMNENFDDGKVIICKELPIGDMTADELFESLEEMAFKTFIDIYPFIIKGLKEGVKYVCDSAKHIDGGKRIYYPASMVDWSRERYVASLQMPEDKYRQLRAVHFEGKQLPIIKINGREFEMRAVK